MSCDKIWRSVDSIRKSFETFYTGPYNELRCRPKHFLIEINDNINNDVSLDRLKSNVKTFVNKNILMTTKSNSCR